ncbi:MAG: polysaccharide deacetylase family protein [Bacteroidales bacterium]|nr:polysaccharide deacetylase family protein [Bacteroidales bacterium]
MSKKIMLSFDTEEYDVPREHGVEITMNESMKVSGYGTTRILDCLKECGVKATFFCTTNFATNAPDIIRRIIDEGHEVASHGCDHFQPKPEHVILSKQMLEADFGIQIKGYRQPRMFPVDLQELKRQGYVYNASLNPAFIPGRYMHLNTPRTSFMEEGLLQIPASVSPWLRIPMFWLALHNFPLWLYKKLLHRIVSHDDYFNTYFHPWEFYPLGEHPEYKMPYIIRHNAGQSMYERLKSVILDCKSRGYEFITYCEFSEEKIQQRS